MSFSYSFLNFYTVEGRADFYNQLYVYLIIVDAFDGENCTNRSTCGIIIFFARSNVKTSIKTHWKIKRNLDNTLFPQTDNLESYFKRSFLVITDSLESSFYGFLQLGFFKCWLSRRATNPTKKKQIYRLHQNISGLGVRVSF